MTDDPASTTDRSPRVSPDLAIMVLVVIWGVNFSVVKAALEQFEPLTFNGLRFALGALVLLPFVLRGPGFRRFDRRDWPMLVGLGVLGNTVYQVLFVYGIDLTLAGNAALMLAVSPVFVTLLSSALRHESIRLAGWIGVLLSLVGIACVLAGTSDIRFGADTLDGDLLMLVAAGAWAIYTVGASPLVRRYGALPVTGITTGIGALLLFVVSVPSLAAQDWQTVTPLGWSLLVGSGILAIGLAYVIWYHGVEHLGSARTAVFSNTVPVVALLTAWLTLGEAPTPIQLVGAALIVGGVLLTRLRGTEKAIREATDLPEGA
jgi:drug/metabolite transporter (DMT)-like permease